jgi:hypothetical protein
VSAGFVDLKSALSLRQIVFSYWRKNFYRHRIFNNLCTMLYVDWDAPTVTWHHFKDFRPNGKPDVSLDKVSRLLLRMTVLW